MYEKLKPIAMRYRHGLVFLYALIYCPWFYLLESRTNVQYYVINSPLDSHIPFLEIFVIPYLAWFVYMTLYAIYFFLKDKTEFLRMAAFLITGMTLFLIICTIFPNAIHLRPLVFERNNIFVDLVKMVYRTDTPTNVLPSIHVYNSLGIMIASAKSKALERHPLAKGISFFTGILIILSTMFLKQHSVTDVMAACTMCIMVYSIVYVLAEKKAPKLLHQPV